MIEIVILAFLVFLLICLACEYAEKRKNTKEGDRQDNAPTIQAEATSDDNNTDNDFDQECQIARYKGHEKGYLAGWEDGLYDCEKGMRYDDNCDYQYEESDEAYREAYASAYEEGFTRGFEERIDYELEVGER